MPTRQSSQQFQQEPAVGGAQQLPQPMGQPTGRAGILPTPRWITPLPAGNNASPITRDPRFGRSPGIYPLWVSGVFALQPTEILGAAINLCYIPFNVILTNFYFITNGVTGTLQDSLATPTVYGTVSGAVYTISNLTGGATDNMGTMYATTPRALGPEGLPVVQWYRGMTLQISGPGGAQTWPTTTPLKFFIQWAPAYDSGVS